MSKQAVELWQMLRASAQQQEQPDEASTLLHKLLINEGSAPAVNPAQDLPLPYLPEWDVAHTQAMLPIADDDTQECAANATKPMDVVVDGGAA